MPIDGSDGEGLDYYYYYYYYSYSYSYSSSSSYYYYYWLLIIDYWLCIMFIFTIDASSNLNIYIYIYIYIIWRAVYLDEQIAGSLQTIWYFKITMPSNDNAHLWHCRRVTGPQIYNIIRYIVLKWSLFCNDHANLYLCNSKRNVRGLLVPEHDTIYVYVTQYDWSTNTIYIGLSKYHKLSQYTLHRYSQ